MNYFFAGGWFLVCVLIGVSLYRQQLNKVRDYRAWVGFCDHLHQAIGFALQPLPQAVAAYLPVCRGACYLVLKKYLELLNSRADLTRTGCQSLTADNTLAEFLYQLGRTGPATEQDKIHAVREILATQAKQAQHDLQTKASIMLKLLIIIGIAGGILWI